MKHMGTIRAWHGVVLALFAAAVSGCRHATPDHIADLAPPNMPPGWNLATDDESGVSVGVAPGWQEGTGAIFDMQQATQSGSDPTASGTSAPNNAAEQMVAGLNTLTSHQAQIQEDTERAAMRKSGILINVIDSSHPTIGEARTRYYVKKIIHDSTWPLADAVQDEKRTLLNPGPGTDVVLPVGKAHRFEDDSTLIDGDKQVKISYVLADGNDTYLIRFISTNSPDVFKPIELDVAKSFRLRHKS